jgi:polysaccharide export outer membrane protein
MTRVRRRVRSLHLTSLAWSLSIAILSSGAGVPARAQPAYRLDIGDVVELSVAGAPELQRRAAVQIDGTISLPLIGAVHAADSAVADVEAIVRAALGRKVLRSRGPDGRRDSAVIDPAEVTLTVASYRPIYVDGDVSRPGEQPYRPVITVRQAVVLCGGYDTVRSRPGNLLLEAADYRSEYESLWLDFVREQAHIWRIKTELGEDAGADDKALGELPLAQSTVQAVLNAERNHLQLRETDFARAKAYLQRDLERTVQEGAVLEEQKRREEQSLQLDIDEQNSVAALFGKGNATNPRMTETRRAVLMSSTRALQTNAQLLQLKRQQDELVHRGQQLEHERRIGLTRDLEDAIVRINQIRAKLRGVGEKLQYTPVRRSQLMAEAARNPEIRIIRKTEQGTRAFTADEDTALEPGDIVEVALRQDSAVAAAR